MKYVIENKIEKIKNRIFFPFKKSDFVTRPLTHHIPYVPQSCADTDATAAEAATARIDRDTIFLFFNVNNC